MRRGANMAEIQRLLVEKGTQTLDQTRMIVTEIDGAKRGEEVEIRTPLMVPDPHILRPDEKPTVAENPKKADERRALDVRSGA